MAEADMKLENDRLCETA